MEMPANGVSFETGTYQLDIPARHEPGELKYTRTRLLKGRSKELCQALGRLLQEQPPCIARVCYAAETWSIYGEPLDTTDVSKAIQNKYENEFEDDLLGLLGSSKFKSREKYFRELADGTATEDPASVFGKYTRVFASYVEKVKMRYRLVDSKIAELVRKYIHPDGTLKKVSKVVTLKLERNLALLRRLRRVGEFCAKCNKKRDSKDWRTSSDRRMLLAIELVIRKHRAKYGWTIGMGEQTFKQLLRFKNDGVKKQLEKATGKWILKGCTYLWMLRNAEAHSANYQDQRDQLLDTCLPPKADELCEELERLPEVRTRAARL
eukprot:5547698-Amphidinium_carterae.2